MYYDAVLPAGWGMRGTCKDRRVRFFCLKQDQPHANVVGRAWTADDLPDPLPGTGAYRLCLLIQEMGDLNSVDVAQLVHEHILHNAGVLDRGTLLRYGHPLLDSVLQDLHRRFRDRFLEASGDLGSCGP